MQVVPLQRVCLLLVRVRAWLRQLGLVWALCGCQPLVPGKPLPAAQDRGRLFKRLSLAQAAVSQQQLDQARVSLDILGRNLLPSKGPSPALRRLVGRGLSPQRAGFQQFQPTAILLRQSNEPEHGASDEADI